MVFDDKMKVFYAVFTFIWKLLGMERFLCELVGVFHEKGWEREEFYFAISFSTKYYKKRCEDDK